MNAFTALATLVSIGAVALTFRSGRKPTRVRPNIDLLRIAISAITIVVITRVSPIETEPAVALLAGVLGGGGGYLIGRHAEVWADGDVLWLKRSGLGLVVWGASTVILQVALAANRADLVDLGRFGSWFGIGMQIGVFIGRMEPVAVVRAAGAAAVGLFGWLAVPQPRQADASAAAVESATASWRLVSTDVAPMEGYTTVSHSPGSFTMTDVDDRGFAASFDATYDPPPDELEPGSTLEMNVSVAGRITQGDVQRFSGLSVIQYSNRRWTDDAVGVSISCYDPIGAEPLSCDDRVAADGTFSWSVPSSGDTFDIGVGALNCDCAIHYVYEFEGGSAAATGVDPGATSEGLDPGFVDPFESDDLESVPSDALGDPFGDGSEGGLDDAEQAGLAGAGGTSVVGVLTALDAIDGRRRRRDDADLLDGGEPDDPIVRSDAHWDPTWYDDELVLDDEELDSVGASDGEFDEELGEWMENLPPPGEGWDTGFDELLESMNDQFEYWNRPFDPDELRRVWDALGRAVDDPSLATRDELQEALATLLDRNVAGMPAWLSAWAVRNPTQAAETIVRLGAAYASGGVSELPWIPVDVYRDIDAARAAHPDGEPFTFTDAVIAGTRGQAIGWVMDGGGRIFTGTGAIGDDLFEAAGDAASASARAGREGAEDALERAGSRFSREELAEQAARGTDARTWNGIDDAPGGTKIPPEHIRDTGYTPQQAAELQRVAAEEDVIIGTRTTNPDATKWIESDRAVAKPEYMKAKTINDLDVELGGPPPDLNGQVGFFKPNEPPPGAGPDLLKRYEERMKQYRDLKGVMDELEESGVIKIDPNGVVNKVMDDGTLKPFAGDIDAVVILDGKTGRPITGDRYRQVVGKLKESGAQLQHGAESNIVGDIVAAATKGKHPSSPEYREAFDAAYEKATKLGAKLDRNHLEGAEQTVWTHGRGSYVGPQTNKLAEWQRMSRGDIPPRPVDMETMGLRSLLRPTTGGDEE